MLYMAISMKRDIQGKFTLKNDDYREVRSVRLTDGTWKALGIAAECLGITRADWLEQLVRENNLTFPAQAGEKPPLGVSLLKLIEEIEALKTRVRYLSEEEPLLKEQTSTNLLEQLTTLSATVLGELKLGKRSRDYKLVNKALRRLIELATRSTPPSK
jgi:hypothetical protein